MSKKQSLAASVLLLAVLGAGVLLQRASLDRSGGASEGDVEVVDREVLRLLDERMEACIASGACRMVTLAEVVRPLPTFRDALLANLEFVLDGLLCRAAGLCREP